MATLLSPAEQLLLLKPNGTPGRDTIKVTLLWLLAQGLLRIEEETRRRLFWTRKVACVRATGRTAPSLPPHAVSLMQAVKGAQPDGGSVEDVVLQARRFYGPQFADFNSRFIFPALVGRGLLEEGRVLLFFRKWKVTPAGTAEQQSIERDIGRARTIPALLHSDPAEAAAIALAVGTTVLLVEELRPHYRQLSEAMQAQAAASGDPGDGGLLSGYWSSDGSRQHGDGSPPRDDQHKHDAAQPGDNASLHDAGTGNLDLGSFDLGAFDVEALGALDVATLDASFDASAGGGDGGGNGGGNGGGD